MKIFLSAVSGQFKACRNALASDLHAIGHEVKVQKDFQQGPRTLIEQLEQYVAQCDRVIALVGDAYGCEASGVAVPSVDPPRSYTSGSYFFALGPPTRRFSRRSQGHLSLSRIPEVSRRTPGRAIG